MFGPERGSVRWFADDPVVNFQFGKLTAETLKGVLGFSKTKFNSYRG
jgi:hypothetical protein